MHTARLREYIEKYSNNAEIRNLQQFKDLEAFYQSLKSQPSQDRNLNDNEQFVLFQLSYLKSTGEASELPADFLKELGDLFSSILKDNKTVFLAQNIYEFEKCIHKLYQSPLFSYNTLKALTSFVEEGQKTIPRETGELKSENDDESKEHDSAEDDRRKEAEDKLKDKISLLTSVIENISALSLPFSEDQFLILCQNSEFLILAANTIQSIVLSDALLKRPKKSKYGYEDKRVKDTDSLLRDLNEAAKQNLSLLFDYKPTQEDVNKMLDALSEHIENNKTDQGSVKVSHFEHLSLYVGFPGSFYSSSNMVIWYDSKELVRQLNEMGRDYRIDSAINSH